MLNRCTHRTVPALLAGLALAACTAETPTADGPGGPENGLWQGDELTFVIRDGAIEELTFVEQSCAGDGCAGKAGGAVQGRHPLAGAIGLELDGVSLKGVFDTPYMASGSLKLRAKNGCCDVVGAWSAEWIKALPGTSSGGSSSGASSGGTSSGGPLGSADWGGHSDGDLHPGPSRAVPEHKNDEQLSAQQNAALGELNKLRAAVGVAPIEQDRALAKAAQAHADFYVKHHSKYQAKGLNPHSEDKSFGEGYTGKTVNDRVKAAGYSGAPGAEVMAFTGSVKAALQGWLDTVYHRLPLIDPRSAKMGFGMASAGKARTEVMDFGRGGGQGPVVVYPWPGQTGVPTSWSGNEGPQPPKPKTGYPSGPVITARFPSPAKVLDHQLLTAKGEPLPHVWLTPENDSNLKMFDDRTVVIYANDPVPSGSYTVRIEAEISGKKRTLRWSFTTK